jgi:hypothetical protein
MWASLSFLALKTIAPFVSLSWIGILKKARAAHYGYSERLFYIFPPRLIGKNDPYTFLAVNSA